MLHFELLSLLVSGIVGDAIASFECRSVLLERVHAANELFFVVFECNPPVHTGLLFNAITALYTKCARYYMQSGNHGAVEIGNCLIDLHHLARHEYGPLLRLELLFPVQRDLNHHPVVSQQFLGLTFRLSLGCFPSLLHLPCILHDDVAYLSALGRFDLQL